MEKSKIARINELAKKAKTAQGLTPAETEERAALRREYIDDMKRSLAAQLDNMEIEGSDGVVRKVKRKQ